MQMYNMLKQRQIDARVTSLVNSLQKRLRVLS